MEDKSSKQCAGIQTCCIVRCQVYFFTYLQGFSKQTYGIDCGVFTIMVWFMCAKLVCMWLMSLCSMVCTRSPILLFMTLQWYVASSCYPGVHLIVSLTNLLHRMT